MTIFDSSMVGIALPLMSDDANIQFTDLQWFVSIYLIFFASMLLPAGLMGDRYGRKKTLLGGLALFSVAALLCSVIEGMFGLVVARALQGVGAAFMLAPALSIIGHSFHGTKETARVWAIWGSIMGLTMILAPIVSSLVGAYGGWRWAFGTMGGCGLVLLLLVLQYIPDSRDPSTQPFAWTSSIMFCAAMMAWTGILILGPDYGWNSGEMLLAYVLALFVSGLYLYLERSRENPMLDLSLFRSLRFNGAVLAMIAYAATAQVMLTYLPLYLQKAQEIAPFWLGIAMLPFSCAMFLFPHLSRRLAGNMPSFKILSLGLGVIALGNFGLATAVSSGELMFFGLMMVLLGAGGGLINGETQKGILGAVPKERAGMASGISTTARFSGVLIGFVVLSVVFAAVVKNALKQRLCEGTDALCQQAGTIAQDVVIGNLQALSTSSAELQMAAEQSYSSGFTGLFATAGVFALIAAVFVRWSMKE